MEDVVHFIFHVVFAFEWAIECVLFIGVYAAFSTEVHRRGGDGPTCCESVAYGLLGATGCLVCLSGWVAVCLVFADDVATGQDL
jgi:hypothetical protein